MVTVQPNRDNIQLVEFRNTNNPALLHAVVSNGAQQKALSFGFPLGTIPVSHNRQ